jgi:hypothetical protein
LLSLQQNCYIPLYDQTESFDLSNLVITLPGNILLKLRFGNGDRIKHNAGKNRGSFRF